MPINNKLTNLQVFEVVVVALHNQYLYDAAGYLCSDTIVVAIDGRLRHGLVCMLKVHLVVVTV